MTQERTAFLIRLRQENPCLTLRELAPRVGLTHERVRQILAEAGVETKARRRCKPPKYQCAQCHKRLTAASKSGFCRSCLYPAVWADLPCNTCSQIVHKRVAAIQANLRRGGRGRVFCNRSCFGRFAAEKWGWRARRVDPWQLGREQILALLKPSQRVAIEQLLQEVL